MRAIPTDIISNWHFRVEGLQQSTNEFYDAVEHKLKEHDAPRVRTERVRFSEGGIGSSKREYLQVRRGEHVFHVCAAPFGNGFFISWWLGYIDSGFFAWLSRLPVIGFVIRHLIKPITYYRLDTANMFQSLTAGCVSQVLDGILEARGMSALAREDYKPTIRDLLGRGR